MESTIIIEASQFIENMPSEYTLTDAQSLEVSWLYNNTALRIGSKKPAVTKIQVPEDGNYTLYIRNYSGAKGKFKIEVDGMQDNKTFGCQPLCWQQGSSYHLSAGEVEVKVIGITPGSFFDVIVLTADPNFSVEQIPQERLPEDIILLREYYICESNTVKFGDLLGDGQIGFVAFERDYSAHAYNYQGEELWSYQAPSLEDSMNRRQSFEPPGVIWDIDQDGKGEVIHWRYIEGQAWLVIANGATGEVKLKTEFPSVEPNDFNNYRIAIARLAPGYPQHIVVFADSGGTISINVYSADLELLWSHVELRKKDNLGHYIYPKDLTGNGIDDIVVGALALDAEGDVIWDQLCPDNHDHIDSIRFFDLDLDGVEEIVAAHSDQGVRILRSKTGDMMWEAPAKHCQQIEAGYFLKDVTKPQIAAGARIYKRLPGVYLSAQIWWYDNNGKLLAKWPSTPLNGNPDFVKGDWLGDGNIQLFWYKFKINNLGKGELSFPDQVYHMFDFTGDGAEEVITLNRGRLRVYGGKNATRKHENAKRDLDYMYKEVVNHTHY